jgi:hypothetical protein
MITWGHALERKSPEEEMVRTVTNRTALSVAAIVALGMLALSGRAQAQGAAPPAPPDVSGTYQCKPNPDPCTWPGASPSISQTGSALQIKGDNGAIAAAKLTSPATISAWATFNSLGIIRPDHSIDWSDGTKWSK